MTALMWLQAAAGVFLGLWGIYKARNNRRSDGAALHAASVLIGLAGLWCAVSAIVTSLPVIADDGRRQFFVIERGPQQVLAVFYGTKTSHGFGRCKWLGTDATVIGQHGARGEADIEFLRDRSPGSSRADGFQQFGLWRITWDALSEPVQSVEFDAYHRCSPLLQVTHTHLGPYPIPPRKDASQ